MVQMVKEQVETLLVPGAFFEHILLVGGVKQV